MLDTIRRLNDSRENWLVNGKKLNPLRRDRMLERNVLFIFSGLKLVKMDCLRFLLFKKIFFDLDKPCKIS